MINPMTRSSAEGLARWLGWFSIGLGAMELLAPKFLARRLGLRGRERLVAGYGLREVATGAGILLARNPTPWIWGRVAGDALDIATLAGASRRGNTGIALAMVAGVTALDLLCGQALAVRPRGTVRDYGDRSGFPRPPEQMRRAAADFKAPEDFRTPAPLRPMAG